ncbi:zinc ribbon domain-containing protein [Streptomyces yangpuensis]|uniref:zinc ribbon domain-containing protein n=1 Tax=Streptomyces yangpuensis TaxID=1648182 RepID=UPI0006299897|nr:zinc ribbon domain-containing protein [Streptomyces yangpuensis]
MEKNGGRGGAIEHGFPHLATVRASITALFRRMSADGVRAYATSLSPADAAFDASDDLHLGAQRVASAVVRALRLPDVRTVVAFRPMEEAAVVELAAGPEYFIEVNDRFRTHRRDLAAALSHEITHVLLHRLDLAFPDPAENEILTDTAAAYLGVGWLLLDAYREDALTHQRFGYLTPEEFGYVLAKRAALFGEDPSAWFTSPQAYEAYVRGSAPAARDHRRAPLAAAGPLARRRYARARRGGAAPAGAAYRFEPEASGPGLRVAFPCPVCAQWVRVPAGGRLRARCGLCGTVLDCDT